MVKKDYKRVKIDSFANMTSQSTESFWIFKTLKVFNHDFVVSRIILYNRKVLCIVQSEFHKHQ